MGSSMVVVLILSSCVRDRTPLALHPATGQRTIFSLISITELKKPKAKVKSTKEKEEKTMYARGKNICRGGKNRVVLAVSCLTQPKLWYHPKNKHGFPQVVSSVPK